MNGDKCMAKEIWTLFFRPKHQISKAFQGWINSNCVKSLGVIVLFKCKMSECCICPRITAVADMTLCFNLVSPAGENGESDDFWYVCEKQMLLVLFAQILSSILKVTCRQCLQMTASCSFLPEGILWPYIGRWVVPGHYCPGNIPPPM
jgi:hypothetical protein